jgi:hypothetical protein
MRRGLDTYPTADLEGNERPGVLAPGEPELLAKGRVLARHIIKVKHGLDEFSAQSMRDLTAAMLVVEFEAKPGSPGCRR